MTLREKLIAARVRHDEVLVTIFRNIYPLPSRIWWWLRIKLRFDPFTAEREFLDDLVNARRMSDVEDSLRDYHNHQPEYKVFLMRPSRRRVKGYFKRVMET
jgi:hypothetical protein